MEASSGGHVEAVRVLLGAGAKKGTKDNGGNTALIHAAFFGHLAVVQLLVEAGAKRAAKGHGGKTALDCARKNGHAEVAALLSPAEPARETTPAAITRGGCVPALK